jgi:hypothetical protein
VVNTKVGNSIKPSGKGKYAIPVDKLYKIVAGFQPEEIGLSRAWDELYCACQAAAASPQVLQTIHDIKESIEDAEGAA